MSYAASYSTPVTAGNARIDWVDTAKGICILLVVMMHTTLGLEKAVGSTGWMHAVVEFARPFRMPDFFMISGLFLAATIDRPWRLYLDRKVVHFFYFYILWVCIQFAFKAPFMLAEGHAPLAIAKTWAFSAVQPFGTLWFIYMLPVFFVITKLCKSKPWYMLAAAVLLQILPINSSELWASVIGQTGIISVDSHWVLVDEFCSFFVYFLIGYLFAPHLFALADAANKNVAKALGGLGLWLLINLVMVVGGYASLPPLSLALGSAGALAIVTFASVIAKSNVGQGLNYLGARSIVVYLAFFIPMVISRLVLMKFFPAMDVGSMAALSTAFAALSPLVGLMIIKRVGFGHFLFTRPAWAYLADKPARQNIAVQPAE